MARCNDWSGAGRREEGETDVVDVFSMVALLEDLGGRGLSISRSRSCSSSSVMQGLVDPEEFSPLRNMRVKRDPRRLWIEEEEVERVVGMALTPTLTGASSVDVVSMV
jgi:hypothetical protein